MSCTQCKGIASFFDEKVAARELRQYRKRGPHKTTQMLIDAIRETADGAETLLDIGGGVGAIQHALVGEGVVARGFDVDASHAYLETARAEAERRGYAEKMRYVPGNFVDVADEILDGVVGFVSRHLAPDGRFYDFVNFDFSRARIMARARMSEADVHHRFLHKARRLARSFQHISAIPTGLMVLYNDVERHMLTGMITGFSVAFITVSLMMVILLRTLRHGLLAMIPGALPVVFVVGMTGWLGVALGTMPAMMGNVALGIAVDNAIHMLTRYRRLRRSGMAPQGAIEQAAIVVGRPVLFTTSVLCLGFAVLGFSRLVPNQFFGILTAIVLFGSLVGALVTLPATILVIDERSAARQAEPRPSRAEAAEPSGGGHEPVESPAADPLE